MAFVRRLTVLPIRPNTWSVRNLNETRILSNSPVNQQPSPETELPTDATPVTTQKQSGFGKAFEKFSKLTEPKEKAPEPDLPFATLLRQSRLMQLGDFKGKLIEGKIKHIVNDDLYIDFGGKFQCVCQRPPANGSAYVRGAKVKLRLNSLELSSKFLGSEKEITLREADATLLGLIRFPDKKVPQ